MTKKSALEQALLESEEMVQKMTINAKNMLYNQMKPEISQKISESFEDLADKEDKEDDVTSITDSPETIDEPTTGDEPADDIVSDEPITGDEPADDITIDGPSIDDEPAVEVPMMDTDTLDATNMSDDELISVWKKLGDDAEIQVVKNEDNSVNITTPQGEEFLVKLNESDDYALSQELADLEQQFPSDGDDKYSALDTGNEEQEQMYEIEMDDNQLPSPPDEIYYDANAPSNGVANTSQEELPPAPTGDPMANVVIENPIEEVARTHADGRNMTRKPEGFLKYAANRMRPAVNESIATSKVLITEAETLKLQNTELLKENVTLKSDAESYKTTLRLLKENLEKVALFNSKLAYVNKIFCENATTTKEKQVIVERFDNASIVSNKDVQALYKTISTEMSQPKTIKEAVENKIGVSSVNGTTGKPLLESIKPEKTVLNQNVERMKAIMNYNVGKR